MHPLTLGGDGSISLGLTELRGLIIGGETCPIFQSCEKIYTNVAKKCTIGWT